MSEKPIVYVEPRHVALWPKSAAWTHPHWGGRNSSVVPKQVKP